MPKYAKIIVNVHHQKVDRIFTYRLEGEDQKLARVGMMARVSFGNSRYPVNGFIVGLSDEAEFDTEKIKPVEFLYKEKDFFSLEDLEVARWMQKTYMAPLSSCLSLMLPKMLSMKEEAPVFVSPLVSREAALQKKRGKAQTAFLTALYDQLNEEPFAAPLKELRATAPITKTSLESLIDQGIITMKVNSLMDRSGEPSCLIKPAIHKEAFLALNQDQQKAYDAFAKAFDEQRYEGFLLHGITGSGKTEVYMHAIQKALLAGKEAIVLVPEISLTPQLIDIFKKRFGSLVGVTHSRMTDKERSTMWYKAKQGEYRVMIGPRSCLFTPFRNLGLIILDEEHESTYRSEKMAPHYHAREVAVQKAKGAHCPLILGSATPSVETYYRARQGEFTLLSMTKRAVEGAELPYSRVVDMRRELEEGNLSIFCRDLSEGIGRRLVRGEQTILFLNRKGYATSVSCRKCGFILKCPRCYLPYTYHREKNRLICHHCGKETLLPSTCPSCGSKYLKQFGTGTEKVEETVKALYPQAHVVRMDMSTMKTREDYEKVYESFARGEGDILIGTQMVAKGFDFPRVTLVGILAADMTLMEADFHGVERTFQLLTQVSGRAGRAGKKGEVLIQTYLPEHYAIESARRQDYLAFYQDEIKMRRAMECPPFTHIGQMAFSDTSEERVLEEVREMAEKMRRLTEKKPIEILGPSPARLIRINNIFRYKILVKCREEERLRAFLEYCFEKERRKDSRVLVTVDIDPMAIL